MHGTPAPLYLVLILLMFCTACSSLDVPPRADAQTLLVIAKTTQNKSFDSWARRYSVELKKLDGDSAGETTEVWFDNNRQIFTLEAGLEPGRYTVTRLKWISAAGWRFNQAMGEGYPVDWEFRLEEGKATLLALAFTITQVDNGSGIYSQFEFETLSAERRRVLIEKLHALPNARQWPVLPENAS